MKTIKAAAFLVSLLLLGSSVVLGAGVFDPAYLVTVSGTPGPSNFGTPPGPFSVGWSFQLTQPYTLAYLGWYEPAGTTLTESHPVSLWACPDVACAAPVSPTPLASATIDNSDFLSDSFRWEALASRVTLTPGFYLISGYSGIVDPYIHAASGTNVSIAFNPSFQWIDGRWLTESVPTPPALPLADFPSNANNLTSLSYFGPNLGTVPEPGTMGLIGGALLLIATRLKRRA